MNEKLIKHVYKYYFKYKTQELYDIKIRKHKIKNDNIQKIISIIFDKLIFSIFKVLYLETK